MDAPNFLQTLTFIEIMETQTMKHSLSLFIGICLFMLTGATSVHAETQSPEPQIILKMLGAKSEAARLSDSVLIIIDAQREYVDGNCALMQLKLLSKRHP